MSVSDQTQKSLEKVGLTSYEIKSFVSLIKTGESTASDLSKQCGVPYSKIYEVLSVLEEKGWIGSDKSRPTKYFAKSPNSALQTTKQRIEEDFAKNEKIILNDLNPIYKKSGTAERPIPGNSMQITGGEPMLREDITDLIKIMKEEHVDHIQMNTNGIRHALDPEAGRDVRMAGCNNLYLSFDGVTARTNPKNHWEIPYALDTCRKTGTTVVFVPTVIKSINDHELGGIIRYAQKNMDVVHAVNFQPVSLTGRMGKTEREKYRITVPDCIQRIEEQTQGQVTVDDWYPVPSCMPLTNVIEAFSSKPKYELSIHFACGAGTYIFEDADTKKFVPMTRFCAYLIIPPSS